MDILFGSIWKYKNVYSKDIVKLNFKKFIVQAK